MKTNLQILRAMLLWSAFLLYSDVVYAVTKTPDGNVAGSNNDSIPATSYVVQSTSYNLLSPVDSLSFSRRFIHRIGIEARPGYIFPTNPFLRGDNYYGTSISNAFSAHLKYSFQFQPHTAIGRVYRSAYQGIGLSYFDFGDDRQLGKPVSIYLFQGANIVQFNPRLSLNYEWNFGLSFGWKPYDSYENMYNKVIGSKANAYLNTNFYLNWSVSPQLDLTTGIALSHFSNGSTKFPNAGLNTIGLKVGMVYNINRTEDALSKSTYRPVIPRFPCHISYDLVLFGSWRRKGVAYNGEQIASPEAYPVFGFNFAPMYNLGYKFRLGISLDGVYDGSANVYADQYGNEFFKPSFRHQLALGLSGRAEYVMPYFTVGLGVGTNVLHRGGDWNGCYQVLALKIDVTRNSFLHIGYNLQDFHNPNYLMLGLGFRFHNRSPRVHR